MPPFSPLVLLMLLLLLGASWAMFWLLSRRATTGRRGVELGEWAADSGFRLQPADLVLPPVIADLSDRGIAVGEVRFAAENESVLIVQFQSAARDEPIAGAQRHGDWHTWQLLVHRIDADWKPTGLRPAAAASSFIDLFDLKTFSALGDPDRLLVRGADQSAAAALAESWAVALLPPDVGLLLDRNHAVLDFSTRHFDAIEFNRMLWLMRQIIEHLPVPI